MGLSMGQWLSVPMILAGLGLWIFARKRAVSDVEDHVDNSGDNVDPSSSEGEPTEGVEVPVDKDSGAVGGDATTGTAAEPSADTPTADK
jgi:phosphatidylglycerol:prolipoprotein diacylglycerol transferase